MPHARSRVIISNEKPLAFAAFRLLGEAVRD